MEQMLSVSEDRLHRSRIASQLRRKGLRSAAGVDPRPPAQTLLKTANHRLRPRRIYTVSVHAHCRPRVCCKPCHAISSRFSVWFFASRHCELWHDDNTWHIKDLDSCNGIKINDVTVSEASLSDGDIIAIGQCRELIYRFSAAGE